MGTTPLKSDSAGNRECTSWPWWWRK